MSATRDRWALSVDGEKAELLSDDGRWRIVMRRGGATLYDERTGTRTACGSLNDARRLADRRSKAVAP